MSDRQIACRDCGNNFTFTAGEQDFFNQKGFSDPVRCPDCRKKRKAEKDDRNGSNQNHRNNSYGRNYNKW